MFRAVRAADAADADDRPVGVHRIAAARGVDWHRQSGAASARMAGSTTSRMIGPRNRPPTTTVAPVPRSALPGGGARSPPRNNE
jgi:hypothetical protein